jgi:hypothetical protein
MSYYEELKSKINISNVALELGDVREIMGDAAYRKYVLKKLNFC